MPPTPSAPAPLLWAVQRPSSASACVEALERELAETPPTHWEEGTETAAERGAATLAAAGSRNAGARPYLARFDADLALPVWPSSAGNSSGDAILVVEARVDSAWAAQEGNASPGVDPATHLSQARTDPDWSERCHKRPHAT